MSTEIMGSASMLAMEEVGCFHLPGIACSFLHHKAKHYHATSYAKPEGWMDYLRKAEVLNDADLDRFVNYM